MKSPPLTSRRLPIRLFRNDQACLLLLLLSGYSTCSCRSSLFESEPVVSERSPYRVSELRATGRRLALRASRAENSAGEATPRLSRLRGEGMLAVGPDSDMRRWLGTASQDGRCGSGWSRLNWYDLVDRLLGEKQEVLFRRINVC